MSNIQYTLYVYNIQEYITRMKYVCMHAGLNVRMYRALEPTCLPLAKEQRGGAEQAARLCPRGSSLPAALGPQHLPLAALPLRGA